MRSREWPEGKLCVALGELAVVAHVTVEAGRAWVWLAESQRYAAVRVEELQEVTIVRGPPNGDVVEVRVE